MMPINRESTTSDFVFSPDKPARHHTKINTQKRMLVRDIMTLPIAPNPKLGVPRYSYINRDRRSARSIGQRLSHGSHSVQSAQPQIKLRSHSSASTTFKIRVVDEVTNPFESSTVWDS